MSPRRASLLLVLALGLVATVAAGEPTWDARCLKRTDCKKQAEHLPVCRDTVQDRVWIDDLLADPKKYAGKTILLRGALGKGPSTCTQKACAPNMCCNQCIAEVVISGDKAKNKGFVRLERAGSPDLFRCVGDDSWVCCRVLAVDHQVRAKGTVAVDASGSVTLRGADVCDM